MRWDESGLIQGCHLVRNVNDSNPIHFAQHASGQIARTYTLSSTFFPLKTPSVTYPEASSEMNVAASSTFQSGISSKQTISSSPVFPPTPSSSYPTFIRSFLCTSSTCCPASRSFVKFKPFAWLIWGLCQSLSAMTHVSFCKEPSLAIILARLFSKLSLVSRAANCAWRAFASHTLDFCALP